MTQDTIGNAIAQMVTAAGQRMDVEGVIDQELWDLAQNYTDSKVVYTLAAIVSHLQAPDGCTGPELIERLRRAANEQWPAGSVDESESPGTANLSPGIVVEQLARAAIEDTSGDEMKWERLEDSPIWPVAQAYCYPDVTGQIDDRGAR